VGREWASAGLGVDLGVDLGTEGVGGFFEGAFGGGLGGVVGARGGDVVVEFMSAAPTSGRHPRSPTTQRKKAATRIHAA
jgi:hypothetical protein